jgi:signal transduction histidine kinase
VPNIAAAGASALAIAALLWAARVSSGARGAAAEYRDKMAGLEEKLARADSVFGAYAGVVLIWEDVDFDPTKEDLGEPRVYGSPLALAGLLKFTDEALSEEPAIRILEGLADHEARDTSGADTTLRVRLHELRRQGTPFSLTIIGPGNRLLEADGRTAGARAVVWITDASIKKLEESAQRSRFIEAERIIAENPQAFLNMLERAPFPAWQVSGMGKLSWVNPAYLRYSEAGDARAVVDRQAVLSAAVAVQTRRTIAENLEIDETHTINVGGNSYSMRVLTFPLAGGAGAMAFDVTEQHAVRRELKHHVKAHEETLNQVRDAIAIFSRERKLIYHNRAFAEMWGLDEGYLVNQPTHGQLLDQLRSERKLPVQRDYGSWRADELERYQHIRAGGDEDRWDLPDGRNVTVTRQRHPLGGLLLLFRDLTEEIRFKMGYKELYDTQSAALNNLHEAVAVFSSAGQLQFCNDAFRKLWNLDPEHVAKGTDFSVIAARCQESYHPQETWATIRARITDPSPEARQRETGGEMKRPDRSIVTFTTMGLPDGNTLIAMVDVTAQRRWEGLMAEKNRALKEAQDLKNTFVRKAAYNLRIPLTTVIGYADFLQTQGPGALNDRQQEMVRSILEAGGTLDRLVDNLLDLAIIEAGEMELDLAPVSVEDMIAKAVEAGATRAVDTQIVIRTDIAPDLGVIQADAKRIVQVLSHLIHNAQSLTSPGGEIVVSAQRLGEGGVRLSVRDNGRGIAPDQQIAVFGAFGLEDTRVDGLGLALVRQFIELHGGTVKMASVPGEGSEVICTLPALARPRGIPGIAAGTTGSSAYS